MYQIIFLNGPTSVGKTTLCKTIQEKSEKPFLHIGVDRMIGMMPAKVNNYEGKIKTEGYYIEEVKDKEGKIVRNIKSGAFGEKMWTTYIETVRLFGKLGHYVVVDEVAIGKPQMDRWRKSLDGFKVLWVALKAPLDVLEKRETQRGNRVIGSARGQHVKVHEGVDFYDLVFDSSEKSMEEIASTILSKGF